MAQQEYSTSWRSRNRTTVAYALIGVTVREDADDRQQRDLEIQPQ